MNPDLIEYQKMMMAQQPPAQQYAPVQMPQMPPMQQDMGNPIHAGTMAGMEAAKHSLGMDAHERQRALGHAMLKFFNNMGKTGHGPGFSGALGAINSSIMPAVSAFQGEEGAVMNRNYELMKRQQEMRRHAEQMDLNRLKYEDAKLHRDRSHAISRERLDLLRGKISSKNGVSVPEDMIIKTENGDIDLSQYPAITTAAQKTLYTKKYDIFSNVEKDLNKIKSTFGKLNEASKDNIFSPLGSILGSYPNYTKDYLARTAGDTQLGRELRKETMLRQELISLFARLEPVLERGNKGAAPDAQLLKRFHDLKVYFNQSQPAYIIKERLDNLIEDTKALKSASRLSLMTGRQIPVLPTDSSGSEEMAEDGNPLENDNVSLGGVSNEQKQAAAAKIRERFPQLQGTSFTDDQLINWARERGQ